LSDNIQSITRLPNYQITRSPHPSPLLQDQHTNNQRPANENGLGGEAQIARSTKDERLTWRRAG
jgi:hypothetical protein